MATAVQRRGAQVRSAFTLLELLIAMGLTLLLVYAIAEFYSFVGESVRDGRALIEMGSDLRGAVKQLRDDLNSLTARAEPPGDPNNAQGSFEIIEGAASDLDADGDGNQDAGIVGNAAVGPMMGDLDDIVTFTIRSSGAPFVGHYQFFVEGSGFSQRTVESQLAEVVWFTTFKDINADGLWQRDEPRFLVRRMFLVVPNILGWQDANGNPHYGELVDPTPNPMPGNTFHYNDVSQAAPFFNNTLNLWVWRTNSLSTLTRRENRFVHLDLDLSNGSQNGLINVNNWLPLPLALDLANSASLQAFTLQGNNTGDDLILPNVLAFDARVYDPQAVLFGDDATNPLAAIQPGDPGYAAILQAKQANSNVFPPVGFGAYVDLWYNRALAPMFINQPSALPNTIFSWAPDARCVPAAYRHDVSQSTPPYFRDFGGRPLVCSWDIWSTYYERDGNNQDGDMATDEGTNGLDDDGVNGVDDPGEFETRPPYPSWIGNNGVDDDLDGTIDEQGSNAQDEQALSRPAASPRLRGVQVRMRLYEVGTRQTQQATIVADFLEE